MARRLLIVSVSILAITIGYAVIAQAMPAKIAMQTLRTMFGFSATSTITVTNTPFYSSVLYPPSNLLVTYVNDSDLLVSWDLGNEAANTEIIANYNHYPTTRTDGYVLYDSTGTSVDDISVNLNEYWGNYYVSAWSQGANGIWTTEYISAEYEVDMTALVAEMQQWLLFLVLVFVNALAFWKGEQRRFLWVIPAFANVIIGLLFMSGVTQYSATWVIGFAVVMLGLYCFTEFIMWGVGIITKRGNKRG
jgi:hypothetical protein